MGLRESRPRTAGLSLEEIALIDAQVQELQVLGKELLGLLAGWQHDPARQDGVICPNLKV